MPKPCYQMQLRAAFTQSLLHFLPKKSKASLAFDICHAIFGKNAEKRHKHFKAFFACQDPMLPTPSKKTHPNHKFDIFWAMSIASSWRLGMLANIFPVMSKLLAFKEDIKTSKELATRKKEMVSRLTSSVRMGTLTLSTFEMLLLPRNISRRSVPPCTPESFSCLTSFHAK